MWRNHRGVILNIKRQSSNVASGVSINGIMAATHTSGCQLIGGMQQHVAALAG